MSESMKAYVISDRTGDRAGSYVVYATTARDARKGAYIDGVAWIDLAAKRAAQFDGFAPDGPRLRDLIEAGWYWECGDCAKHVTKYHEGAVLGDDEAFCDERCEARRRGWDAGREFKNREVAAAEREAVRRWPDATICHALYLNTAWCGSPPIDGFRVYVRLRFATSGRYATWHEGDRHFVLDPTESTHAL